MEVLDIEIPSCPEVFGLDPAASPFLPETRPSPTREYRGLTLRSAFQPITSIAHGNAVGYEALLRATTRRGRPVAPSVVFEEAEDVGELLLLNQIVTDLHIASFCSQDNGNSWLFLNISTSAFAPMVAESGNLLEIAGRHGIAASRIVIEVLEHDIIDSEGFDHCLAKYKSAGFMVAMDDFGKGWSNFDRIFNYAPSIVKFDLSLVPQGRANTKVQRAYRHLTSMLHEVGIMVLAEGIECLEDAAFMDEAGVDFLQGYWLSRPQPSTWAPQVAERSRELRNHSAEQAGRMDQEEGAGRAAIETALSLAADLFAVTGDIDGAAAIFNAVPNARHLRIIDENGYDIGTVSSPWAECDSQRHAQLAPLRPDRVGRFTHRKYFRDALRWPNRVHFVSPIYSLADGMSSDLVAKAVTRDGAWFVVCGVCLRP